MLVNLLTLVAAASSVFTYIRSDQDGSEVEEIVIRSPAPGEVHVLKMREPCTSAAYVTARLDPETGQAASLVGGRLRRDGGQLPQATLWRDRSGMLVATSPSGEQLFEPVRVSDRWMLYDFDFSDWIAHPPAAIVAHEDFSIDLPLVWIEQGITMSNLGRLELIYSGSGTAGGTIFHHYRARGEALGGKEGRFWFDADGRLLDVVMPIPNHSEYSDLRLRRIGQDAADGAWETRIAAHWTGCD